ncbi:flippase [Thermincola ferriacetica]
MNTAKKIGRNFIALVSSEIVSRIIAYFIIVYIARKFGANAFGNLSFAQVFISYVAIFTDFGLSTLAIREVAKEKEMTGFYVFNLVFVRTIISIVLLLLVLIFIKKGPISDEVKPLLTIYSIGLLIMPFDINWVFQAHQIMKYNSFLKVLNQSFYLVSFLLLLYVSDRLIIVPIASITGMFLSVIIGWRLYFQKIIISGTTRKYLNWKHIINEAYPIGISTLMYSVYLSFDTVMLNFMKGSHITGLYSAAYKIIFLLLTVTNFYNVVMLPVLAKSYNESKVSAERMINCSIRLFAVIAFPLCFGGFKVAKELIEIIYGSAFSDSVLSLQILLIATGIIFISAPLNLSLLACNQQKKLTTIVFVGALLNTVLNLILIPRFSLNGAASATAFTEFIILVLSFKNIRKTLDVKLLPYLWRPFISALVMVALLNIIKNLVPVYWSILTGAVIYLLLLTLIRGVNKQDWLMFKDVFKLKLTKDGC